MSSILLLLDDGEMHTFPTTSVVTSAGSNVNANSLVFTARPSVNNGQNDPDAETTLQLGSHFLTTREVAEVVDGKVDTDRIGVVIDKSSIEPQAEEDQDAQDNKVRLPSKKTLKGSNNKNPTDKKVCLWPMPNGNTCGKTFTKFDSLKRHLAEAHKGVRPYACSLCEKSYGRRDYLQRHLKSHNANYAVTLSSNGVANATIGTMGSNPQHSVIANSPSDEGIPVKKARARHIVQAPSRIQSKPLQSNIAATQEDQAQSIVVQLQTGQDSVLGSGGPGTVQILQPQSLNQQNTQQHSQHQSALPFINLNGPSTSSTVSSQSSQSSGKPMGTKICRWVQNDGTVCGKAFSKLDSLRRHVNETHKGVRPFACNVCEKSYGRRDYLDRHMLTHKRKLEHSEPESSTTELDWSGSPSSMTLIPNGIKTEEKVIRKKRKHIPDEEKKVCLWVMDDGNPCGKAFAKFDSLKRHVSEAHKGVRPFSCTLCGKCYGRRDYLLRHLKSCPHNEADIAGMDLNKAVDSQSVVVVANSSSSSANNRGGSSSTTSQPQINFNSLQPHPPSQTLVISTVAADEASPSSALRDANSIVLSTSPVFPMSGNGSGNAFQQNHSTPLPRTPVSGMISSPGSKNGKKNRRSADDKKTCKWVLDNGTVCGKAFSKFDSLRRHVNELHKAIRPFQCSYCNKNYGRKDYLDRHLKSCEASRNGTLSPTLQSKLEPQDLPSAEEVLPSVSVVRDEVPMDGDGS